MAAIGILNQLGRPDTEPLEVLIREAVQNCWDAKRPDSQGIRVEIGRSTLDSEMVTRLRDNVLVDPPPGLALAKELRDGMCTLYVADFGTHGLAGPTRADRQGEPRDFVDFVRNIGQPPDKDFGGGSFGYGKAAFYIASTARTVVIDSLCEVASGKFERRLLGCALGDTFDVNGVPYTGRHWWGRMVNGAPEPVTGDEADEIADLLGLPARAGADGRGTTVLVVAPSVHIETDDGVDATMDFIAEAIAWNFWPRMIDTLGGARRTMEFVLRDNGKPIRIPNPRSHQRLRGFVEAMDRHRQEPTDDVDDLTIDTEIRSLRPVRRLGRLTIQKGPVAPADLADRPVPRGARITATSVHHVALMRTPELVVNYFAGAAPASGRLGYSGVFKCALDVDDMFKAAEPPTHDDWIYRAVQDRQWRSFVKIALERVERHCRLAAGYDASVQQLRESDAIPLGEFADALAALMPGQDGPGARRQGPKRDTKSGTRRRAPGRRVVDKVTEDAWVDATTSRNAEQNAGNTGDHSGRDSATRQRPRPLPPPQTRVAGDPSPVISLDGTPVIAYPFELRTKGNRVRLTADVEIMTNDGALVELEPPIGYVRPTVHCWVDPSGSRYAAAELTVGPDGVDGEWAVEIELRDEMMRVDLAVEAI
ncbi:hypothetical protein H7K44_24225 [Mycobacterium florentinum]|uniref:hypothetical protein n=1 Tax=Mycobacterium florentinum TaxID=292462 RepID=UPI00111C3849|nr:hypothetical protein [Mycobacterium florentinum]MCV7412708.1 hypothetical protein [Mycobacterium florentinum]